MFKDVFETVSTQLSEDPTLLTYVSNFEEVLKENIPKQSYTTVIWSLYESEKPESRTYNGIKEFTYQIDIYARMVLVNRIDYMTSGYTDGDGNTFKGILEFCDDIKHAIRKTRTTRTGTVPDDLIANYNTNAYSESDANGSSSFDLTALNSNITVTIGDKTPTGYNAINCGTSTLTGDEIAENIQTSLVALGRWGDDGYKNALVTFDSDTNKFKIESDIGPRLIAVTAGTNDCSMLLGFDNPTEVRGKRITNYEFDTVTDSGTEVYPVRYRIIPLIVTEEVYVGG